MKPLIKEDLRKHIYFYSLLYLAASIPFQFLWFPPTLGLIFIMAAWIFSFEFKTKWKNLRKNKSLIFILALFALSLAGMLYTSNTEEGWKDVLVKISLLFLPLAVGSYPPLAVKKRNILLATFVYSIALAIVVLLGIATSKYIDDGNVRHFFYGNFAALKRVPIHYFALYINLSFFITLHFFTKRIKTLQLKNILGYSLLLVLQLSALFLCSVRIQFIALLIGLAVFFVRHFRNKLKSYQMALSLIGIAAILFAISWLVPESKRRIIETMDEYSAFRGREELKQMNHRVFLWKYGSEVIKENFWTGTGTGSANDHLHEYLKDEKAQFWNGSGTYTLGEKKYNYHNEFLQYFATHGILGILILLIVLSHPFFPTQHPYGMIATSFLVLTIISFMTESMLERQAGNLYFAFFYALLVVNRSREN